jgi:TIR domain
MARDRIKIFISYASEDRQLAGQITSELRGTFALAPVEVNRDEDFKVGSNWKDAIDNAVDTADILLVLFTERTKPSHSFTGYEIGYFNSSIKRHASICQGLKRIYILFCIGDVNIPDTMYYIEGTKINSSDIFKIPDTNIQKNDDAWSRNPTNPLVKLLNQISEIIVKGVGPEITKEGRAAIETAISKSARNLYGYIDEYLQGRIFRESFPERKLVIRAAKPIEFEDDGANLDDSRVELVGQSFDSFGIPEAAGRAREFAWLDFIGRMNSAAAMASWREGIKLLVSSVLQGEGDNFRLFVSRIVTYVSKETEIHIYVVQIRRKVYGDQQTMQLLKCVETGMRFRSLILDQSSEFAPEILGFPTMRLEYLKPKITELLSQMNFILYDAKVANLSDPILLQKIWGDNIRQLQEMMEIWEGARAGFYSTAEQVLHTTPADFPTKKIAFIDALTSLGKQTETMNRKFTSKAMHLLADKIAAGNPGLANDLK